MSDGLWMVSGAESVKLWRRPCYEQQLEWRPHTGNVSDIATSSDGLFLATASDKGDRICVHFEGGDGQYRAIILANQERQDYISFSTSASCQLASGGRDGVINIWDIKTQSLRKKLQGHNRPITGLVYNCKGTHLASASSSGEILVHNVTSGEKTATLKPSKMVSVSCVRSHSRRQVTLASVDDYGNCHLWDCHQSKPVHTFSTLHSAPAKGLAFSPINEILMVTCGLDKSAIFLDQRTKRSIKKLTLREPLVSVDLLSNGITLAVGSTCGTVFIFDLRNTENPSHTLDAHQQWVNAVRFQGAARNADPVIRKEVTDKGSVPIGRLEIDEEKKPHCETINRFVIKQEVFSPLEVVNDRSFLNTSPLVTPTRRVEAHCETAFKNDVFSPLESSAEVHRTKDDTLPVEESSIPAAVEDGSHNETIGGERAQTNPVVTERKDFGAQVGMGFDMVSKETQTEAPAKDTLPWDVQAIKELVKDAVEDVRDEARALTMDLRVDMARFVVELQLEMENMFKRGCLDENMAGRIVMVMEENERLRQQLGMARRPR